jgi:hypothetical protein
LENMIELDYCHGGIFVFDADGKKYKN